MHLSFTPINKFRHAAKCKSSFSHLSNSVNRLQILDIECLRGFEATKTKLSQKLCES